MIFFCEEITAENVATLSGAWPGFTDFIVHFGYLGIFLWFISIDQFTPIPEEITLVTIGYLAAHGLFDPLLAGIVSLSAFLCVDLAYFFLARSGNKLVKKIYGGKRRPLFHQYEVKIKDNFPKTLFVLCFIPRMRMFAPLLAGALKLSPRKFIFYDALGLFFFTAIYVSVGIFLHRSLRLIFGEEKIIVHFLFAGALIVLAVVFFVVIKKRKTTRAGA